MYMKNVAIIYGGPSSEHDISIQSGKNILKNIDKKKYNVFDIFISKDKKFFIKNDKKGIDEKSFINLLKKENINIVYPVLHGSYGEDGQIQKLLEKSKINFDFVIVGFLLFFISMIWLLMSETLRD